MRVLVYDDDPVTRHGLESALRARKNDVMGCADPVAAREAIASLRPPLIILDWSGTEGQDLCRWTRALPGGQAIHILAAGISDSPAELQRALDVGADDYLSKEQDLGILDGRLAVAERGAQKALARGELEKEVARLRRALEVVPVGVSLTDCDGRILYANAEEARVHGCDATELVGSEARLFSPRESWQPMSDAALREARQWHRERRQLRKDGSSFLARLFSDVVTDEAGSPAGLVTTCEDVTSLRETQQALKDTENLILDVLEGLEEAAASIAADGEILFLNRGFEALTGWARSAFVGTDAFSILHPEDAGRARKLLGPALRGEGVPRAELRLLTQGGAMVSCECTAIPAPEGGALFMARDISERRRRVQADAVFSAARAALLEAGLQGSGPRILKAFCVGLGFESGLLWVPEGGERGLGCMASFVLPGGALGASIPALLEDRNWRDGACLQKGGSHLALLVPLLAEGEPLAVIELRQRAGKPHDARIVRVASELGERVGEFIAKGFVARPHGGGTAGIASIPESLRGPA